MLYFFSVTLLTKEAQGAIESVFFHDTDITNKCSQRVALGFFLIFNKNNNLRDSMKKNIIIETSFMFSLLSGILFFPRLIDPFPSLTQHSQWLKQVPKNMQVGEILSLTIPDTLFSTHISLVLNGKSMSFVNFKKKFIGSVGFHSSSTVTLKGYWKETKSNWVWFQKNITIQKPLLSTAKPLRLPSAVWKKVSQKQNSRKAAERKKMGLLWERPLIKMTDQCFSLPLKSIEVSSFASPRTLPSGYSYYHSGVDLRARTGTVIRSIGQGKIVLAEHMVVPGRVVVVNHGVGIFSRYMHLSEINVSVGQNISSQQILGKAGATGRVQAAHLHWEVLWKGLPLSPKKFIENWTCKKHLTSL